MKGRLRTVYSPYARVTESDRNEKALADHTRSNAALSGRAFEKVVECVGCYSREQNQRL